MNCPFCVGEGGDRWLMLSSTHWRRPYKTCSYVIRIVFSLLMSSSSGGLSRPPAVRQKLARTPWGRGLKCPHPNCNAAKMLHPDSINPHPKNSCGSRRTGEVSKNTGTYTVSRIRIRLVCPDPNCNEAKMLDPDSMNLETETLIQVCTYLLIQMHWRDE
jgi:hypothetical protein